MTNGLTLPPGEATAASLNLAGDGPRGLVSNSEPSMDQAHPDQAATATTPELSSPQPSNDGHPRLWRALAGMALALALAVGIILIDVSHDLVHRVSSYRSRIATLNKRVDRLKQKAVEDEKRLADARAEIKERKLMQSRDRMKAILIAPDHKTLKLLPPDGRELAAATVTISERMGGGMLNVHGLGAPPEGQVYDAWWMLKDAPAAKAAEFRTNADGIASTYLDLPPQGAIADSLSITIEPSEGGIAPSGPVKLRGKLASAVREERGSGSRKH